MSLLSSVLGAVAGKSENGAEANPMLVILTTLLTQSGGLQGLMNRFSQAGLGNVFSSWVATGPNPPVSGDQVQQAIGCDQLKHLPSIVDQLTPAGKIDPQTHSEEGLSSLLPSLFGKLGGSGTVAS